VNNQREPDVEALVTYLSTEDGGRKSAMYEGFSPNHLVRDDYLTSGRHEFLDKDVVYPGDTVRVNVWFITPGVYPNTLWVGREISVQEAGHVIGTAGITKIYNKVLEKSS